MKTLLCFVLGAALVAAGCSHAASNDATDADSGVASPPSAPTDDHDAGPPEDAASTDGSASGASAAATAARTDPLCTALGPFYWEIGDVNGALVSGAGGTTVSASTEMDIASASKLLFGAYVVERFKDDLTKMDSRAMQMLSGYTSLVFLSCVGAQTVQACLDKGNNGVYTAANADKFFYDGGHFQKYAVDLGLGAMDNAALADELRRLIGTEITFTFTSPQLAGGGHASAASYSAFLRKILAGGLALHDHLGENAVCTLPAQCPTAISSPAAPEAWHYSYGHWVEDDPTNGDGAFSSPGAFGFYPWIDATKRYYGIVARHSLKTDAYITSARCGGAIRRAFFGKP